MFHADIREMVQRSTYRGVAVGSLGEEGSQARAGRLQAERVAKLDVEKVVDVMKTRTDSIVPFLHTGLSKVYSSTERAQIESIRTLLNLQLFTRVVERLGAINTATIHFKRWVDSAKLLQPELLILISLKELRMQFQCFLRKLEELVPTLLNLENKQIFSLLLHPQLHHFKGFQSVMAVLANASVAMGLESWVLSWSIITTPGGSSPRPG